MALHSLFRAIDFWVLCLDCMDNIYLFKTTLYVMSMYCELRTIRIDPLKSLVLHGVIFAITLKGCIGVLVLMVSAGRIYTTHADVHRIFEIQHMHERM
jgi:succinate dehydrogenase/fumarate reductase cytochrome b subunit